jgi:hypothetical protein
MAATYKKQSLHLLSIRSGTPFWPILSRTLFSLLTSTAASTIVGKVMNLSRNRPSPSDDVILHRADQTLHEVARTKSRVRGDFRFEGRAGSHFLVAVLHQKASYHYAVCRS